MITPYLRYRVGRIQENAAAIHDALHHAGKTWAPVLSADLPLTILQTVVSLTSAASCRTIDDAESLASIGFQNLIFTKPIVDPLALIRLAKLSNSLRVTTIIDHFRQAEVLSHSLNGQADVGVLIAVDAGQQSIGVRPGPDSVLLAAAAQRLRGIQLRGVFIDDRQSSSFAETLAVARHCQRLIEKSGIVCPEIVTGVDHASSIIAGDGVTTCPGSPLRSSMKSHTPDNLPLVEVVGRVLSRPSLEWCVIDVGRPLIGDACQTLIFQPTGARLLHCRQDDSTLSLTGASLDLRIGDEVTVSSSRLGESALVNRIVAEASGNL